MKTLDFLRVTETVFKEFMDQMAERFKDLFGPFLLSARFALIDETLNLGKDELDKDDVDVLFNKMLERLPGIVDKFTKTLDDDSSADLYARSWLSVKMYQMPILKETSENFLKRLKETNPPISKFLPEVFHFGVSSHILSIVINYVLLVSSYFVEDDINLEEDVKVSLNLSLMHKEYNEPIYKYLPSLSEEEGRVHKQALINRMKGVQGGSTTGSN